MRFAQAIINTFPQLEMRLPTRTFTERVAFTGTQRTSEFVTLGGGHTESDAFLHLPAERLIFTGDLLVVRNHPYLTHGHPRDWLTILAKIKALDPVCLIPGHGELGTLAEVGAVERYLNELLWLAEENSGPCHPAESALAVQPPSFTAGWEHADAFEQNIKFLQAGVP